MKLNLSQFKKVSSDKDKAVLKHKDGHEFHVAMKALDPKTRGEIARMESSKDDSSKDEKKSDKKEDKSKDKKNSEKPSAHQGKFLMMADGGEVPGVDPELQQLIQPDQNSSQLPTAEQTPASDMPIAASAQQPIPTADTPASESDAAAATPDQSAGVAAQVSSAPAAAAPMAPPSASINDQGLGIGGAMDLMQQGLTQGAQAEGDLGHKEAAIAQHNAAQQQQALDHFNESSQQINGEISNIIQDVKAGHIDPNRYLNSRSTGDKIASAIGLILGGIGSGVTHTENPAMKFINDQIDRDVNAQKANMDKQFNLVAAYNKQFGNLKDATDMARVSTAAITAANMEAAAANAKDPLAKARLLSAVGEMKARYAPLVTTISAVQAINKSANAGASDAAVAPILDQLRAVNPERAKEVEARYVPGVGVAQVPVPPEVRQQLVAKTNLVRSAGALRDWVAKNGHSVDPRVRAEGETLAAELQQIYRQGVGGSTSEGEQKVIEKIIDSDPGKVLSMTMDPRLKALEHSMTRSLNTMKQQYQLPTQSVEQQRAGQLPPQQQQWVKWAQDPANANNPKAKMLLQKLGVQ